VVATLTAHHLFLTIDDVVADSRCFCKPVAKRQHDREVLLQTVMSGNPKFFFGTDSAPHPISAKVGPGKISAGVFTQTAATQYVLDAIDLAIKEGILKEEDCSVLKLQGFLSDHGRRFYKLDPAVKEKISLKRILESKQGSATLKTKNVEVFLFREGLTGWQIDWV
jgi:dihydroorotase